MMRLSQERFYFVTTLLFIILIFWGGKGNVLDKGSHREVSIPTKPRSRSVSDVVVLNSQIPLLAGLLIKYQRLPRGFFWNRYFPVLVY